MPEMLCVGYGYSARALARRLVVRGWSISGTSRSAETAERLTREGFESFPYSGERHDAEIAKRLSRVTHLLLSAPPGEHGDPLLAHHAEDIAKASSLTWIGYLSTVGVYGNHEGAWISEEAPLKAVQKRGQWRIAAEQAWLDFGERTGKPVMIFRLAGIYGPGRNAIDKLITGKARRILKPGQVFNRIHVEDIAATLEASIENPAPGAVYNVADNEPAPPQDLIAYGAGLLGVEPPPGIDFDRAELTPMARSFYGENKRVSNARIREELGVELAYPTYRDGLKALRRVE